MRRGLAAWALALAHGLCSAQGAVPAPAAPASTAPPATTTTDDISCGPAE